MSTRTYGEMLLDTLQAAMTAPPLKMFDEDKGRDVVVGHYSRIDIEEADIDALEHDGCLDVLRTRAELEGWHLTGVPMGEWALVRNRNRP